MEIVTAASFFHDKLKFQVTVNCSWNLKNVHLKHKSRRINVAILSK